MATARGEGSSNRIIDRRRRPITMLLLVGPFLLLVCTTRLSLLWPAQRGLEMAAATVGKAQQCRQLKQENDQIEQAVRYLQTGPGRALAARSELGAVTPGERAVRGVVRQQPPQKLKLATRIQTCISRVRGQATASMQYALRVVGVWLGTQEPEEPPPGEPAAGSGGAENAVTGNEASEAGAVHPAKN